MRCGFAWIALAAVCGCSSSSADNAQTAVDTSDATTPAVEGHGGAGGAGQTTGGAGGSVGAGGDRTQVPDAASSAAGGAGTANVDSGGSPALDGSTDAPATGFACTEVIGLVLTHEWYQAGFENGVDDAKWQLKWAEHSYVDEWAKPASPFWDTPIESPCAQHSTAPDRVVFVALSWTLISESDWEKPLSATVDNIKTKYPSVRAIDLLTIIRGPGNTACDPNPNATESTKIPAGADAAIAAVAARNPGLVSIGPKVEATACSDFTGVGPHLTTAGNMKMAQLYSAYYAKHP